MITRYDIETRDCMGGWGSITEMVEREQGDYVEYEDHAARVAQVEANHAQLLLHYHAAAEIHSADGQRIAELEAAIDKLAQCKGRFHTEANFKALIAVREKNLHK